MISNVVNSFSRGLGKFSAGSVMPMVSLGAGSAFRMGRMQLGSSLCRPMTRTLGHLPIYSNYPPTASIKMPQKSFTMRYLSTFSSKDPIAKIHGLGSGLNPHIIRPTLTDEYNPSAAASRLLHAELTKTFLNMKSRMPTPQLSQMKSIARHVQGGIDHTQQIKDLFVITDKKDNGLDLEKEVFQKDLSGNKVAALEKYVYEGTTHGPQRFNANQTEEICTQYWILGGYNQIVEMMEGIADPQVRHSAEVMKFFARALMKSKYYNPDNAITTLEIVVKDHPRDAEAYAILSDIYGVKKNAAHKMYRECLSKEGPSKETVHFYQLCFPKSLLGNPDEALKAYHSCSYLAEKYDRKSQEKGFCLQSS
jgi:hypothetical protein